MIQTITNPIYFSPEKSIRFRLAVSLFYGLFVFFFIVLFQPFGLWQGPNSLLLQIGLKYALITFGIVNVNFFIRKEIMIHLKEWNVLYAILFNVFALFHIGFFNTLFTSFDVPGETFNDLFWPMQLNTFKIGSIPIILEALYLRNQHLKQYITEEKTKVAKRLFLKDLKGSQTPVYEKDITLVRSDDHYQKIYTTESFFYVRNTISFFEKELSKELFQRVHRSTIVNISSIRKITPYGNGEFVLDMQHGETVKVSRKYAKEVKKLMLGVE